MVGGRMSSSYEAMSNALGKDPEVAASELNEASRKGTSLALAGIAQYVQRLPFSKTTRSKFQRLREDSADPKCGSHTLETLLDELLYNIIEDLLEHGLRLVAERFNVPFATDSWHKVIRGVEEGLAGLRNRSALSDADRRDITVYSEAAAQFRYFKDAWRNHVSHSRESYDERDASTVMTHVREFMHHLATNA